MDPSYLSHLIPYSSFSFSCSSFLFFKCANCCPIPGILCLLYSVLGMFFAFLFLCFTPLRYSVLAYSPIFPPSLSRIASFLTLYPLSLFIFLSLAFISTLYCYFLDLYPLLFAVCSQLEYNLHKGKDFIYIVSRIPSPRSTPET